MQILATKENCMTPTPELLNLARRFHELGGTKGHKFADDDLVITPDGDVARLHQEQAGLFTPFERYFDVDCIPILTESELWTWLRKHTRDFQIDKNEVWVSIDIESRSTKLKKLHFTLYTAAAFVAERMEK
jgi:hypothetical protein